jgi:hypothetical protein
MSDLNRMLNGMFDKRAEPDAGELGELAQELFSEADRLLITLQRPENREILRFALSWSKLERQMEALKRTVDARLREIREREEDPLSVFFQ